VERGSFRPVTKVTLDMLDCAQSQFVQEPPVQGEPLVVLMEMTLKNLTEGGVIDNRDFLDRVDLLGSLGKTVLISNYGEYYRLAAYLFRYTKKMIGVAMGVPTLRELFEEKYYAESRRRHSESFGRLFKNALKLYVYPLKDPASGALITAENLRVAPNLRHLYAYMLENLSIQGLRGYSDACLPIFSRDVLAKIRKSDGSWENMVPAASRSAHQRAKTFRLQVIVATSAKRLRAWRSRVRRIVAGAASGGLPIAGQTARLRTSGCRVPWPAFGSYRQCPQAHGRPAFRIVPFGHAEDRIKANAAQRNAIVQHRFSFFGHISTQPARFSFTCAVSVMSSSPP